MPSEAESAFIAVTFRLRCPLRACAAVVLLTALSARSVAAAPQEAGRALPAPGHAGGPAIDGPPPPVPPEVIARDDRGRVTMRAVRVDQPLRLDGRLDEDVYRSVPPAAGFVQQEPHDGAPATEPTEIWVFFDSTNVYVAARCWDSHPERWSVSELRRDGDVNQSENVSVMFDTFYDHRNGFYFGTSPLGTLRDQTFTDEGNQNLSWNTVWHVRAGRFDGGWTFEMAIPFKSLRYRGAGPQVWGINVRRIVKWKNEITFLSRVPAAYGRTGVFRISFAATLVGLEAPAESKNLELKPYVVSALTTDRAAPVPFANAVSSNAGVDFKYGMTRSLTADVTYNTDFAQVEEDVQQINLTRFSLLFPEKRDFFLEGQGIFLFGGAGPGSGGAARDVPILFFSRRIGLSRGQSVPVVAGARVTGKAGKVGIGALDIQTRDRPSAGAVATNFAVVRLKRDVLRRSSVGVLATRRAPAAGDAGSNLTAGVDANLQLRANLTINSYYARTRTAGRAGDESSYRGRFEYENDRYGLELEHLHVGDGFNPEVGFTRRVDFQRSTARVLFSPRVRSSRRMRKVYWTGSLDYVTDGRREVLENRTTQGSFRIEFENSDQWSVDYTRDFEYLPQRFEIARNIVLPVGAYRHQVVRTGYVFGQQRSVSGRLSATWGPFYEGHRREVEYTNGRVHLSPLFSLEPGVTLNWIDLPQGRFANRLVTTRAIVTPSPRMAISSLLQFNAGGHTLNSSVRLRWEYTPGSELFVVYSDGRTTTAAAGVPHVVNRSFAVKLTRLFRF